MKRFSVVIMVVFMLLSASGCGFFSDDSDQLLRCPTPGGEYEKIIDVLNSEISANYTLKYAKYGDLKSAFVVSDLDGDKIQDEAVVFYSTTRSGNETLNFALFEKDEEWRMKGKTAVGGTDIEKLELGDIDGDGKLEAAIGWSSYGAPETRLSVFSLLGDIPVSIHECSYSYFTVYDMNNDGKENLLICAIDNPSGTVKFSLHEFEKGVIRQISECDADKGLTSVRRFVKAKLGSKPAVYVDASFGSEAYFTEIIYFDGKRLSAPIYEQSGQTHTLTKRFKDIPSQDLNGDGEIDIPTQSILPAAEEADKTLYLTSWKKYSDTGLKTTERSIISPSMQYRFKINKDWIGSFTAVRTLSDGMIFYKYSGKNGRGEKLFEVDYLSRDAYDEDKNGSIFYSDEENVAVGKIYSKDGVEIYFEDFEKKFKKMKID